MSAQRRGVMRPQGNQAMVPSRDESFPTESTLNADNVLRNSTLLLRSVRIDKQSVRRCQ